MVAACRPQRAPGIAAGRDPATCRLRRARRAVAAALGLLLLAAAGCGGGAAGDAEAIRALIANEANAMSREDLKALSEIWSPDKDIVLIDVPPPGRFRGWESIARTFGAFFDRLDDIRLTIAAIEVHVEGRVGYATWDWALAGRMGEQAVSDRGQATAVYRREAGAWKLVHAHYSAVPPAQALLAEEAAGAPPAQAAPGAAAGPVKPDAPPPAEGPR